MRQKSSTELLPSCNWEFQKWDPFCMARAPKAISLLALYWRIIANRSPILQVFSRRLGVSLGGDELSASHEVRCTGGSSLLFEILLAVVSVSE